MEPHSKLSITVLFLNVYSLCSKRHPRSGSSLFHFSFMISLCLAYICPLYLQSLWGTLPRDVTPSGILNKRAIRECRAESRVPEEQNTRDFVSSASSSQVSNGKGHKRVGISSGIKTITTLLQYSQCMANTSFFLIRIKR